MNQFFDKEDEPQTDKPEKTSYGQKVFEMVKGINIEFGKKKKAKEDGTTEKMKKRKWDMMEEEQPPVTAVPFKKQSCFFKNLSYWKELDTPHAIDCMHLSKNVFESVMWGRQYQRRSRVRSTDGPAEQAPATISG